MPYFSPPDDDAEGQRKVKKERHPYSYQRIWETDEVAKALAALSDKKSTVLRSYVHEVVLGTMGVREWLKQPNCPVSKTGWYRSAGKNYYNDDDFKHALEAYKHHLLAWQTRSEQDKVQQAAHKLRLHSLAAVEGLIEMMADGEKDADKIRAMNSILDRAGVGTAVKSSQEVTGADGGPVQIYIPDNARDSEDE